MFLLCFKDLNTLKHCIFIKNVNSTNKDVELANKILVDLFTTKTMIFLFLNAAYKITFPLF